MRLTLIRYRFRDCTIGGVLNWGPLNVTADGESVVYQGCTFRAPIVPLAQPKRGGVIAASAATDVAGVVADLNGLVSAIRSAGLVQ